MIQRYQEGTQSHAEGWGETEIHRKYTETGQTWSDLEYGRKYINGAWEDVLDNAKEELILFEGGNAEASRPNDWVKQHENTNAVEGDDYRRNANVIFTEQKGITVGKYGNMLIGFEVPKLYLYQLIKIQYSKIEWNYSGTYPDGTAGFLKVFCFSSRPGTLKVGATEYSPGFCNESVNHFGIGSGSFSEGIVYDGSCNLTIEPLEPNRDSRYLLIGLETTDPRAVVNIGITGITAYQNL